jgi:hypothetical protein
MTHLSVFILIATVVIGLTCSYEYYYFDDEHKKAFGSMIATFIMLFFFSFVFIKVGWLPDFIDIKSVKTELVSDKKTTEVFAAKKVYRDGDNAILEDEGGHKVVVNLYGWETEVYHNGEKERNVKVTGLYWYTTHLNQIKNKEKFVKTKIFKSKDGSLKGVEILIEDNKHKKDFEVSY